MQYCRTLASLILSSLSEEDFYLSLLLRCSHFLYSAARHPEIWSHTSSGSASAALFPSSSSGMCDFMGPLRVYGFLKGVESSDFSVYAADIDYFNHCRRWPCRLSPSSSFPYNCWMVYVWPAHVMYKMYILRVWVQPPCTSYWLPQLIRQNNEHAERVHRGIHTHTRNVY